MSQISYGSGDNFATEQGDINIILESKNLFSNLSEIIGILGKRLVIDDEDATALPPFSPKAKVTHNNLVKYRRIIELYRVYAGKLSVVYGEFDRAGKSTTQYTLININTHYERIKGEYVAATPLNDELEVVRAHADEIFDKVQQTLLREVKSSYNLTEPLETVNVCLTAIMVDAFMRCKILERPE